MVLIQCNTKPNFLVVGAAKCGTTSLYHYLKQHPDVYMSPIKEPNFFSTDIQPSEFSAEYKRYERSKNLNIESYINGDMSTPQWGAYVHDPVLYCKLFRFANGRKAIGEISNSYLYSSVAANNIHIALPDTKIIVVLRQPAERAYSHYMANLRDGRTRLSFRKEIETDDKKKQHGWGISHLYYELGLYHSQVKRYLDLFPRHQVKILFSEDLKSKGSTIISEVFDFLELDRYDSFQPNEQFNEARVPKSSALVELITQTGIKRRVFRLLPNSIQKPVKNVFFKKGTPAPMETSDFVWMTERYREDIISLGNLLNRDLQHWLQPNKKLQP